MRVGEIDWLGCSASTGSSTSCVGALDQTGVCDATEGPGATKLLSPLGEAYCLSVPPVVIISDLSRVWEPRHLRATPGSGG